MPGRAVNCADDTFSASPGKILPGLANYFMVVCLRRGNTTEVLTHTHTLKRNASRWMVNRTWVQGR
jgi:hypothetical protein